MTREWPEGWTACPSCGSTKIVQEIVEQPFPYGGKRPDGTYLMLSAVVPLVTCMNCADSFTDWRGEEKRDEAVKVYLAQKEKV